jgi:hypothetical protein
MRVSVHAYRLTRRITEDARRADIATQILVADFEVRSMRHYRAEPDA